MREIKFRGKDRMEGEWRYGSFIENCQSDFDSYIQDEAGTHCEIDRNTVGEYTGLKDKNGVEIYEGDILLVSDRWNGVVEYNCGRYMVGEETELGKAYTYSGVEVIGNIYNAPTHKE